MPTTPQITIVGLGLIGASFGLALKRQELQVRIIGHDKSGEASQKAKSLGAVEYTEWNLITACKDADVVFLALPTSIIQPALEALRDNLKPGCLVMDTATIKAPILEMAQTILPDNVHFVGSDPVLASSEMFAMRQPSATLFDKATWALCPTLTTAGEALQAASDLVTATGATPYFLEAEEHDGLLAAVTGLPTVLAAALMNLAAGHNAWGEARRLAGAEFERSTYLPGFTAEDFSQATWENRANITRWIDSLVDELQAWQEDLRAADAQPIEKRFAQAETARAKWLHLRELGEWEQRAKPAELPTMWERLLGTGGRKRRAREEG